MDCSFTCVVLEVNLRQHLMGKRIDYRFRALISVGSTDEILVKYLRSKDLELSEKNMVLWAAAAYWLPLALQKHGCSNGQLKQNARTAIYKLRQHINFLAQTFGLENEFESTTTVGATSPKTELETTTLSIISPQTEQSQDELGNRLATELLEEKDSYQTQTEPETTQLLHHNDDKMFEALFVQ